MLQSIVPNNVIAGSGPVTLVLNGSGFNQSSIVGGLGRNLVPQLLGQDQLQVVVPAEVFSTSARLGVIVFNRDTNLGSDPLPFYVYSPFPPVVRSVIPAGGIRGTTSQLTLNGQNLIGATVSFGGNGIAMVPQRNGDLVVGVASDAPLGVRSLTVTTPFGSTSVCGERPCTFSAIDSGVWTNVSLSPFEPNFFPGLIIRLLDGRVLVAGGFVPVTGPGQSPVPLSSAWIFDPAAGQWNATRSMLEPTFGSPTGTLLPDGRVLVFPSGASGTPPAPGIYDPSTGAWSTVAPPSADGVLGAVLLPSGKVLVQHNAIDHFDADIFDPATERFQHAPGAFFSVPSGPITMALLADGRVLVLGSGKENRIYDPVTGTLSNVPSLNVNSTVQWARLLPDGHVLVRGGSVLGPFTPFVSAFIYDAQTNSASHVVDSFNTIGPDVLLTSGLVLINRILLGRTVSGFIDISSPFLYDTTKDQILPQTPVNPPIATTVLLDDGRVFGFGKIYTPAASTNPAPVIGSVISNSAASNADNISLDIRGAHFLPNSIVRLGQRRLVTLYLGSQRLVAFVPPALRSSINAGISVNNSGPGGGQTESVQPGFTATAPLPISEVENGAVRSGYVVVTPDAGNAAPVATLTYGIVRDAIVQSQAAILPTALTIATALQVDTVKAIGRDVGIAIANPGSDTATISLTLRNQDGTAATSVVTFPLFAQSQVARFVSELFSPEAMGSAFRGNLTIQSSIPVSIVGLRFSGQEFSSIPIPSSAASGSSASIVFPQFAISGGWATTLGLLNNSGAAVSGRVEIFDKNGRPLSVTLNGGNNSTFAYSIPAHGSFTLAPRDSNGQSPF